MSHNRAEITKHQIAANSIRLNKNIVNNFIYLTLILSVTHILAESFVDDYMLSRLQEKYGIDARQRGANLGGLIEKIKSATVINQLTEINRYFNRFAYEEDKTQWGVSDYWATPEEFIGTSRGDCEDFVIAKYFALRSLGIEDSRLYLTYVKSIPLNAAHMVLSYFESPRSIPLILDNYEPRILSADRRKDLLPVYSFNASSLFLTNSSAGLGQALPTQKVKNSKWTRLLEAVQGDKR